jgi:hypothetical protein
MTLCPPRAATIALALSAFASAFLAPAAALGQWTVTPMNPPGSVSAQLFAVGGGIGGIKQAGVVDNGGGNNGGTWTGTPASFTALGKFVTGYSDGQAVGANLVSLSVQAWVFTPTATKLHPASGVASSIAWGVGAGPGGTEQVGVVAPGSLPNAARWLGTAASLVVLHPAGASESTAYAVGDGREAGYATIGGVKQAGVWTGTAASWSPVHPAGATESVLFGAGGGGVGGQQVGYAIVGGVSGAGRWSGTAGSFVSLHPVGATASVATACSSAYQVGNATINGLHVAGTWTGAAGTWQPLPLPPPPVGGPGWGDSLAAGVYTDASGTTVVGSVLDPLTGRYTALMWTRPPNPTCCQADYDCSGTLAVADIFAFLNSWFAGEARANFDGMNGLQVADIFAFLNAWFAGCH